MPDSTAKQLPAIDLSSCSGEGLYLLFADGRFMNFSKECVKEVSDRYWSDPSKLPEHTHQDPNFRTCSICPYRGQNAFCSAMKPVLAVSGGTRHIQII